MRRRDIRIALLLGIALLIASPVALTAEVPRDSATTVTMDAGYEYEDTRGEYLIDADVSDNSMVTSLDAPTILQTASAGCRIAVGEYTVAVADTIRVPIRVEGGVDVGSLDLNITFDPTLLSVKSTQSGAFDSTTINPEADSGVIKVIAYQAVNPGINSSFTVAEITFESLGVGESPIDLEIVTLTDSSPQVNYLVHLICNGTITIC